MKTLMKKTAAAAVVILLALFLVTCELELPGPGGPTTEYTDWEYEELPDGRAYLTMYLDGTKVPVTATTSRALGLKLAQMSHDYFEVVFVNGAAIARATWGIGQQAGISGVSRASPGVDYTGITPSGTAASSIVFVGRKQTMTLMGVGYLTHINKVLITGSRVLTTADKSVTFTVSPLTAKIGITGSNVATADSSFLTAAGGGYATGDIAANNTPGSLTPLGGVDYPLFKLPDWAERNTAPASGDKIAAEYTIGGLSQGTNFPNAGFNDLTPAVRLLEKPKIQKREPRYISGGQTFYAVSQIDFETEAELPTSFTPADDSAVFTTLPIEFTIKPSSSGIFSIVFSIPVYALTKLDSTNGNAALLPETWYITPGYGENLYNLDTGSNAGGCVLLGINVSSLDWLEIFTTGL